MLAILLCIFLLNWYLYKTLLNPILLQSLVWLVYYIILKNNISHFNTSLNKLDNFILLQSIGFSLGGFLCWLFTNKKWVTQKQAIPQEKLNLIQQNGNIFFPIMFCLLCFATVGVVMQNGSFSISKIADLRDQLTADDGKKYGLFGLIQSIISVYLLVMFSAYKKMPLRYYVTLIVFVYLSLLLGAKGPFLFFFGSLVYVLLWQKRIKKIVVLYSAIGLFCVMAFIANLRLANTKLSLNDGDVVEDLLLTYSVASIPALEISPIDKPKTLGYHTFRIPYLWMNKLGTNYPVADVLSEFIITPIPTNTCSYIKPYYFDFGYAGILILPLILGVIHNIAYFRSNTGNVSSLILTSLLIYPLFLQIIDEQYFRWMTNWLYFSVIIFILTRVRIYEYRSCNSNLQPTN